MKSTVCFQVEECILILIAYMKHGISGRPASWNCNYIIPIELELFEPENLY